MGKNKETEQIKMPIKKDTKEVVNKLKMNINKSLTYSSVVPHWRNFTFVLSFLIFIFIALLFGLFLFKEYSNLQNIIPLIYNQTTGSWSTTDKSSLLIIFVSFLVVNIVLLILNARIFRFNRRVVFVLCMATILTNIFFFIAITQIFSLLVIY